jgi:hypothetical protein
LRQLKKKLKEFPKPEIHRRNTGYAVDILLKSDLFSGTEPTINVGKYFVVVGCCIYHRGYSEGRYFTSTNNVMVVAHFHSIQESLEAVVTAMKHHLYTCEMMDDTILNVPKPTGNKPKPIFYSR